MLYIIVKPIGVYHIMKLTESMLRNIIREQLESILNEAGGRIGMGGGFGGNIQTVDKSTATPKPTPMSIDAAFTETQKSTIIDNVDYKMADLESGRFSLDMNQKQVDWLLRQLGTSLEAVKEKRRKRMSAEYDQSRKGRFAHISPF